MWRCKWVETQGSNSVGQLGSQKSGNAFAPSRVEGLPDDEIIQLESGDFHSCLMTSSNEVFCWGWNGFGQIGSGNFTDSFSASRVPLQGFSEGRLILSSHGSCVVSESNGDFCWGSPPVPNTFDISGHSNEPLEVSHEWNLVFVGDGHSCFNSGGSLECSDGLSSHPYIISGFEVLHQKRIQLFCSNRGERHLRRRT